MKLTPRNVDLVGDFAGSDLFIVEGDSLLLECFSNKKLDFSPGFQLLHATYLVERFLKKLRQRKCVFEIVFFAQNARLCIPADADDGLEDRYLFAREVIVRHLIAISKKSPSDFKVTCFYTFEEQSFAEHLVTLGVYLLVCHDGALVGRTEDSVCDSSSQDDDSVSVSDNECNPELENDSEMEEKEDEETLPGNSSHSFNSQIQLRRMIHWFCVHGQNVSLINTVSFRATKVSIAI